MLVKPAEQPFADKEAYHTTIVLTEPQDFRRSDVCVKHAGKSKYSDRRTRLAQRFISYWHGVYEAPHAGPGNRSKRTRPNRCCAS